VLEFVKKMFKNFVFTITYNNNNNNNNNNNTMESTQELAIYAP